MEQEWGEAAAQCLEQRRPQTGCWILASLAQLYSPEPWSCWEVLAHHLKGAGIEHEAWPCPWRFHSQSLAATSGSGRGPFGLLQPASQPPHCSRRAATIASSLHPSLCGADPPSRARCRAHGIAAAAPGLRLAGGNTRGESHNDATSLHLNKKKTSKRRTDFHNYQLALQMAGTRSRARLSRQRRPRLRWGDA